MMNNYYSCDIGHYAQDLLSWFSSQELVDLDHFCAIASSERSLVKKVSSDRNSMKIYPNPATSDLVICKLSSPAAYDGSIQLCDQTGRILKTIQVKIGQVEVLISLDAIETGIYTLTSRIGNEPVASSQIIIK
jgi:hypothetical protein